MNGKIIILIAALACQASANVLDPRKLQIGGGSGGFFGAFSEMAGSAGNALTGGSEKIQELFNADKVQSAMTEGAEKFQGAMSQGAEKFQDAMNEIAQNVQTSADKMKGQIETVMESMKQGAGKAVCEFSKMVNKMQSLIPKGAEFMKDFKAKIGKAFCETMQPVANILSGVNGMMKPMVDTLTQMQQQLTTGSDLSDQFQAMMQGFQTNALNADAIKEVVSNFIENAPEMLEKLVNAMQQSGVDTSAIQEAISESSVQLQGAIQQ